jgi:cytochrome c-type biogenesis protein CcmE
MNRNLRFVVGSLVIVGAIAYLMVTGIQETSAYYLTIKEFLPKKEDYAGQPIRVAGRVQAGSIQYDPRTLQLGFHLGEFGEAAAPDLWVPVSFTGIKPDMFADGRDVIVEGKYASGVLAADKVLTSCPSKYEAKTQEASDSAPGQGEG